MNSIHITPYEKRDVEDWLNIVNYEFKGFMPTEHALMFVNFINQVNDGAEENETPLVHLVMMDNVFNEERRCAVLCHRGIGKTSLFGEYLFLFIAAFGYLPGFGEVSIALYITDSIENGVKNLRRNIEHRYQESDFLQQLIPNKRISVMSDNSQYSLDQYDSASNAGIKFTDIRLEFVNNKGHKFVVKGYGARTGVRGAKEMGKRPTLAIFDDMVSDTDAESPTVIGNIENTVYKAVSKALHPTKQKMVWLGTPYNAKDPLYKAVESGAWQVSVFPICERFPCTEEEFKGSWEDRFPYDYVKKEYDEALALGKPANFNQELMLRIMSEDDRLLTDAEISWYQLEALLANKYRYNYYITTDFAVTEDEANDFSVISVWALSSDSHWFWVDGICKKQTMDKNIEDLFMLAAKWKKNLQYVGVEVSGQQGGFISWIQKEFLTKNVYFNLASNKKGGAPGIESKGKKIVRFNAILPRFKIFQIHFPIELKNTAPMLECINELSLVSKSGFKSKHDDFVDTISMLAVMKEYTPDSGISHTKKSGGIWGLDFDEEDENYNDMDSYVV